MHYLPISYTETYKKAVDMTYHRVFGKWINWDNPQTFTEKLNWLKVHDVSFEKILCADKLKLSKYCMSKLGKDICIPNLAVYKSAEECLAKSHGECILKCNHGSGMNIIQHTKTLSDADVKKLHEWMNTDYGKIHNELHYSFIDKKIISEPLLSNIVDIKCFCFNGHPKFWQVDRHFAEHRMNFYSLNWELLPYSRKSYPSNAKIHDTKPVFINEMQQCAKVLSDGFKFVRVDFIVQPNKWYLGEMTFIPGAGIQSYVHDEDNVIGAMLCL